MLKTIRSFYVDDIEGQAIIGSFFTKDDVKLEKLRLNGNEVEVATTFNGGEGTVSADWSACNVSIQRHEPPPSVYGGHSPYMNLKIVVTFDIDKFTVRLAEDSK